MHERKRLACLLGLYPLLGYYDASVILLGLTSGIRTTSPGLLASSICRVAMMIALKNIADYTTTSRSKLNFINADQTMSYAADQTF